MHPSSPTDNNHMHKVTTITANERSHLITTHQPTKTTRSIASSDSDVRKEEQPSDPLAACGTSNFSAFVGCPRSPYKKKTNNPDHVTVAPSKDDPCLPVPREVTTKTTVCWTSANVRNLVLAISVTAIAAVIIIFWMGASSSTTGHGHTPGEPKQVAALAASAVVLLWNDSQLPTSASDHVYLDNNNNNNNNNTTGPRFAGPRIEDMTAEQLELRQDILQSRPGTGLDGSFWTVVGRAEHGTTRPKSWVVNVGYGTARHCVRTRIGTWSFS
ncbi:hypothetical protein ACA910_000695 [Epithemia clementina (nom. ined.)]